MQPNSLIRIAQLVRSQPSPNLFDCQDYFLIKGEGDAALSRGSKLFWGMRKEWGAISDLEKAIGNVYCQNVEELKTKKGLWTLYDGENELCLVYWRNQRKGRFMRTLFVAPSCDKELAKETASYLSSEVLEGRLSFINSANPPTVAQITSALSFIGYWAYIWFDIGHTVATKTMGVEVYKGFHYYFNSIANNLGMPALVSSLAETVVITASLFPAFILPPLLARLVYDPIAFLFDKNRMKGFDERATPFLYGAQATCHLYLISHSNTAD